MSPCLCLCFVFISLYIAVYIYIITVIQTREIAHLMDYKLYFTHLKVLKVMNSVQLIPVSLFFGCLSEMMFDDITIYFGDNEEVDLPGKDCPPTLGSPGFRFPLFYSELEVVRLFVEKACILWVHLNGTEAPRVFFLNITLCVCC